jgi:hypothetical protein
LFPPKEPKKSGSPPGFFFRRRERHGIATPVDMLAA